MTKGENNFTSETLFLLESQPGKPVALLWVSDQSTRRKDFIGCADTAETDGTRPLPGCHSEKKENEIPLRSTLSNTVYCSKQGVKFSAVSLFMWKGGGRFSFLMAKEDISSLWSLWLTPIRLPFSFPTKHQGKINRSLSLSANKSMQARLFIC